LRHVVGKKKRDGSAVSGSDNSDEEKKKKRGETNKDESPQEESPPQKTKDDNGKGKAKATHVDKKGEMQGHVDQEREWTGRYRERKHEEEEMWKSTSQWRWQVLTGKVRNAEKIGEEKWTAAMASNGVPKAPCSARSEQQDICNNDL
jgi:hypothetical protein